MLAGKSTLAPARRAPGSCDGPPEMRARNARKVRFFHDLKKMLFCAFNWSLSKAADEKSHVVSRFLELLHEK